MGLAVFFFLEIKRFLRPSLRFKIEDVGEGLFSSIVATAFPC
jgi:hypothetical protein